MTKLSARLWLFLWRWKATPVAEPIPARCVMIAAPHTTNWDFPLMLALARVSGVKISWLGKASLFRGPLGPVMRRLGGVAVDRAAPNGMVAALGGQFAERDRLVLVVPAEGTRSGSARKSSRTLRLETSRAPRRARRTGYRNHRAVWRSGSRTDGGVHGIEVSVGCCQLLTAHQRSNARAKTCQGRDTATIWNLMVPSAVRVTVNDSSPCSGCTDRVP